MAEDEKRRRKPAPKMRLSEEKRNRFLEVLGQTGNRRLAAEAIGVDARLMDQRREFDPLLDKKWNEAVEQADRRLAGASGPLDCIGGAEPMVIRRGPGGRMRIVKAGPKRWNRDVEDRFFAMLAMTGNISASARAVGFTTSCIAHRRRQWPDFARRMEETLEDAEVELEFRFVAEVSGKRRAGAGAGADPEPASAPEGPLDLDAAMRFLKWRGEKKRSGGPRSNLPRPRTLDEVRESILRKLSAIHRHRRAKQLAEGWSEDEEGNMIPPGWVRAQPPQEGEAGEPKA